MNGGRPQGLTPVGVPAAIGIVALLARAAMASPPITDLACESTFHGGRPGRLRQECGPTRLWSGRNVGWFGHEKAKTSAWLVRRSHVPPWSERYGLLPGMPRAADKGTSRFATSDVRSRTRSA